MIWEIVCPGLGAKAEACPCVGPSSGSSVGTSVGKRWRRLMTLTGCAPSSVVGCASMAFISGASAMTRALRSTSCAWDSVASSPNA